jgi:DNA-binding transcriptional MerR regulator
MLHRPQDVAAQLSVSSPTLRLWSAFFAEALSPFARKTAPTGQATAQRRYTDDDIDTLLRVRSLLRQGLTLEQAKQQMREPGRARPQPPEPQQARPQPYEPAPTRPQPYELDRVEKTETPINPQPSVPVPSSVVAYAPVRPSESALSEQLRAKDNTIAALEEALAAREKALLAIEDTLAAKDKTIDALKDSLQFFNAYLQALGAMQPDSRRGETDQVPRLNELGVDGGQSEGSDGELAKPLWRRVLGLP